MAIHGWDCKLISAKIPYSADFYLVWWIINQITPENCAYIMYNSIKNPFTFPISLLFSTRYYFPIKLLNFLYIIQLLSCTLDLKNRQISSTFSRNNQYLKITIIIEFMQLILFVWVIESRQMIKYRDSGVSFRVSQ